MRFLDDEPTNRDLLCRVDFISALSECIKICETPFVIGLHGTWGTGKTSLMKLIRENLIEHKINTENDNTIFTVWFDTWQYQTTENIELAFIQKTYDAYEKVYQRKIPSDAKDNSSHEDSNNHLNVEAAFDKVFNAFKATASKAFISTISNTNLTFSIPFIEMGVNVDAEKVIEKIKSVEANESRKTSKKICLIRDDFEDFILSIKKELEVSRIVFFIDDLDRCSSSNAVKILEYIKNYLNVDDCVYVLGVDKKALEKHLENEGIPKNEEAEYLDKIIQLPLPVPAINKDVLKNFLKELAKDNSASDYSNLLYDFLVLTRLGENPRHIKRFLNTLTLGQFLIQGLSSSSVGNYSEEKIFKNLALILLIQYLDEHVYSHYRSDPRKLRNHIRGLQKIKRLDPENNQVNDNLIDCNIDKLIDEKIKNVLQAFPESDLLDTDEDYNIYFDYTDSTDISSLKKIETTETLGDFDKLRIKLEQWSHQKNEINLDLSGFRVKGFNFSKYGDLTGTNFKGAWFNYAIFENVKLSTQTDKRTDFTLVDLAFSNIRNADFQGTEAWYSNFYDVKAEKANFSKADLGSASFKQATLTEAIFQGSQCVGCEFNGAVASNAKFSGANLYKANFEGADLKNTDFDKADIGYAKLDGADVFGANFKRVINMSGGTIYKAKNIDSASFEDDFWRNAVDDESDPERINILEKLSSDEFRNKLDKPPFNLNPNQVEYISRCSWKVAASSPGSVPGQ